MNSTTMELISLSSTAEADGDWQLEEVEVYGLATDQTEEQLRAAAAAAGESLEELLESAAVHFQNAELRPSSAALTDEVIRELAEDDRRALD
jgi:type II secretory pathway component PulL